MILNLVPKKKLFTLNAYLHFIETILRTKNIYIL